jgi:hypothetical protein
MPELTPDTEVLRIEGNVTVLKGEAFAFERDFKAFLEFKYSWAGTVVPQDSETGMRLYKVEDIEKYKERIGKLEDGLSRLLQKSNENNDKFKSLSEELEQERKRSGQLSVENENYVSTVDWWKKVYEETVKEKDLIIQSLRNKENGWKTFIKWCKGLWNKMFKNEQPSKTR